ncbi:MAG: alpha/beta hydrolase, partial [Candidatus Promineifilaceae bacterium]|nr:alpha/beta hydrolase [Candidatus Promineifilaceae bacterium]
NLSVLPTFGTDKSALREYANENFSGDMADELNSLVDEMTTHDVRQTLWRISAIADTMSFQPENPGLRDELNKAVMCAEDVPFWDSQAVLELFENAAYPQLAASPPEGYEGNTLICSFFPPSIFEPSFVEPLESDIPVLFLQGQVDAQTPPSQALHVAGNLPNAIYVPFNSEGHVLIGRTAPCPAEIASQFMSDPMGDLDTSCADDYVVDWVLP